MPEVFSPEIHSDAHFTPDRGASVSSNSVNILMVDDHEPNLTALEVILDSPHYHLIKARSGTEAVKAARMHEFAVILLDVQMPGMDGFETALHIRSQEKEHRTPIVFVTAIDRDNAYAERGYEVGAVDYIVKPINPKILKPKIDFFAESFLSRKRVAAFETEARFHLMADAAPAMVWISDHERGSYWYNRACRDFFGSSLNEKDPTSWERCIHPDDLPVRGALYDESFLQQRPFSITYRLRQQGTGYRWVMDNGTPFYDNTGHFRGFLGVCIDIEEQKQAVRARDEFLSIASHELKTPVTSLKLQLQMLDRKLAKDKEAALNVEYLRHLAEVGNRQINQLVNLIDDMLDVSRISTGQMKFDMAEEDLSVIANEVAQAFTEQFRAVDIELLVGWGDEKMESLPVECDRQRIEQVISNLLTNAIKYGQRKPVSLKAFRQGNCAVICVEDQGLGISPENQSRIFERFERAVAPSVVSGLGLGLYISRKIAQAHNGEILVISELGKGSKFQVALPLLISGSPCDKH